MAEATERTLRAKYMDWCSARLAERFLDLSPEEIYALARPEDAAGVDEASPDPEAPKLPSPTDDSYRALVQRVTESLLARTSLPTFEQWSVAYAEAPARFDAELLGFWKEVVEEGGGEAGGPES
jgi:hypothetical protein